MFKFIITLLLVAVVGLLGYRFGRKPLMAMLGHPITEAPADPADKPAASSSPPASNPLAVLAELKSKMPKNAAPLDALPQDALPTTPDQAKPSPPRSTWDPSKAKLPPGMSSGKL